MVSPATVVHPFSYPLVVASLPRMGQRVKLSANSEQLLAIADILKIPSIEKLEVFFVAEHARHGSFRITGDVKAELHQMCVFSLEAFASTKNETVDVRFAPQEKLSPITKSEVERSLEEDEPPELLLDGTIDLGALAVEFVALSLDPYPRKPGIEFVETETGEKPESPFAVLMALKKPPKP
jgi:uncharacterized metal-binding protein YceD (DUF177 family)